MQEKILSKQKTRTSNIHSSEFGAISYDIFGSPYQKLGSFLADDSLDFGYLGKPYNTDTELYDYGFRDYSPEIARFTTVDPIRDGRNWYSYVVNDPVNYVDLWGLAEIIAEDLVQLPNGKITDREDGNLKDKTKIVVQRDKNDNGNNGLYYQSEIQIVIDDYVFSNFPVQSTADHNKLNNGEKQYEGFTLAPGEYTGIMLNKSGSYLDAISLTGNGVELSDYVLIHPDAFTAKGETESYSAINKPYSSACQIMSLEDFENFIQELNALGFYGGVDDEDAWIFGDTIKVEIKSAKKGD